MRHATIPAGEVHEYFTDGTFKFSRTAQNCGDVISFTKAAASEHWELVVRYSDEDALDALAPMGVAVGRWRPGLAIAVDGASGMRTAQLINAFDSAVPAEVPAEDEPGVLNVGTWVAITEAAPAPEED